MDRGKSGAVGKVKAVKKLRLDKVTLRKSVELVVRVVISADCSEPVDFSCGAQNPCRRFVREYERAVQKLADKLPAGDKRYRELKQLAKGIDLIEDD